MRSITYHDTLGEIIYEENAWSGKKHILINGTELIRDKKKKTLYTYATEDGEETVVLKGGYLHGAKLEIRGESIAVTPPTRWYETACGVALVVLYIAWGNSTALCSILPVIGGAIGGAWGGFMAAWSVLTMKKISKVWLKLLAFLGIAALTFAVGFMVALVLILALA